MNTDKQKKDGAEETKIYLTPDSTLQTPEEHQHDQRVDPRKDNSIGVSNDDLHETDIDRMREELDGSRGNSGNEGS